jgi:hypothetical protein
MSNIANFLANELIDHFLRNASYSPAATVYLALYTTDPTDADSGSECSGGSYARESVAFDAAGSRTTANTSDITFTEATASWGTVSHVGVRDALTVGNLLAHGAVTVSKPIGSGDTAKVAAGELDFTFTAS